jgi:hypothetical protein
VSVAPVSAADTEPASTSGGESQLRSRLNALRHDAARAQTADEVRDLLDRGRLRRADGMSDLVGRGSQTPVRPGVDQIIEMPAPLREMLPGRGLRRGSTVSVRGSTSLLLVVLAAATRAGGWAAVVGMPQLGLVAAAESGVALERLALVPEPGLDWPEVVAALLDGIDVVVATPPAGVTPVLARTLAARARQRGTVLVTARGWPSAELTIEADHGIWYGMDDGRGRLRCRTVNVVVRGRGAAERPRHAPMWLLPSSGPIPMISGQPATAEIPLDRDVPRLPATA